MLCLYPRGLPTMLCCHLTHSMFSVFLSSECVFQQLVWLNQDLDKNPSIWLSRNCECPVFHRLLTPRDRHTHGIILILQHPFAFLTMTSDSGLHPVTLRVWLFSAVLSSLDKGRGRGGAHSVVLRSAVMTSFLF